MAKVIILTDSHSISSTDSKHDCPFHLIRHSGIFYTSIRRLPLPPRLHEVLHGVVHQLRDARKAFGL